MQPLSLKISPKRLTTLLVSVFVLNIVMLIGTWFANSGVLNKSGHIVLRIAAQFNLALENVIATWYSSMLLLSIAVVGGCCYFADEQRIVKRKDKILNLGWIVFVLIFSLLSFDEMGSFHEMIGDTEFFKSMGKDTNTSGWYLFYVVIFLVSIFMMLFSVIKFFRNKVALVFAVLGVLSFMSNPVQENYEFASLHNAVDPATYHRPIFFLLLEEGSEIFASFFLLFSFSTYLKYSLRKKHGDLTDAKVYTILLPSQKALKVYAIALVLFGGLLMLIVRWNAWHIEGSDGGIPQNWFPSAMSFIVFLAACYLRLGAIKTGKQHRSIFLAIAFFSLLTSLYFGSNLYASKDSFYKMLDIFLLAGSVITGIVAFLKFREPLAKIGALSWGALILVSYFTNDFSSTAFEYWAFGFLFVAMVAVFCGLKEHSEEGELPIGRKGFIQEEGLQTGSSQSSL